MGIIAAKALVKLVVKLRKIRMTTTENKSNKNENKMISDTSSITLLDVDDKEILTEIDGEYDIIMNWAKVMEEKLLFEIAKIAGSSLGLVYIDKGYQKEHFGIGADGRVPGIGIGIGIGIEGQNGRNIAGSDARTIQSAASLLVGTSIIRNEQGCEEEKGDSDNANIKERSNQDSNWYPILNYQNENRNENKNISNVFDRNSILGILWPTLVLLSPPYENHRHKHRKHSNDVRSDLPLERKTIQKKDTSFNYLTKNENIDKNLRYNQSEGQGQGQGSPGRRELLKSSWKGTVKGSPSPPRDRLKNPSGSSPNRQSPTSSPTSSHTSSPNRISSVSSSHKRFEMVKEGQIKKEEVEDKEEERMITALNILTGRPFIDYHKTVSVTVRKACSSASSSSSFPFQNNKHGQKIGERNEYERRQEYGYGQKEKGKHSVIKERNERSVFDLFGSLYINPMKMKSQKDNIETISTTSESLFSPSFSTSNPTSSSSPTPSTVLSSSMPILPLSTSSWLINDDQTFSSSVSVAPVLTGVMKKENEKEMKNENENENEMEDMFKIFDSTKAKIKKDERKIILLPPSERSGQGNEFLRRKIRTQNKYKFDGTKSLPLNLFHDTDFTVGSTQPSEVLGFTSFAHEDEFITSRLHEDKNIAATVHTFNTKEIEFSPSISTKSPFVATLPATATTATATTATATTTTSSFIASGSTNDDISSTAALPAVPGGLGVNAADLELLFQDKKTTQNFTQSITQKQTLSQTPLSKSLRPPPPLPLQPGVKIKGGMGTLVLKPPPTTTTTIKRAPGRPSSQSFQIEPSFASFGDNVMEDTSSDKSSNMSGSVDAFSTGESRSEFSNSSPWGGSQPLIPTSASSALSSSSTFSSSFSSTTNPSSFPSVNQSLSQTLPPPPRQNMSTSTSTSISTGNGAGVFTPSRSETLTPNLRNAFTATNVKDDPFSTPFSISKSDPFAASVSDPFSSSSTSSTDPFNTSNSNNFASIPVSVPVSLTVNPSSNAFSYSTTSSFSSTFPANPNYHTNQYPAPPGTYNNQPYNTGGRLPGPYYQQGGPYPSPLLQNQQQQMQYNSTYSHSTPYNAQQNFSSSPSLHSYNPQGITYPMIQHSQGQGQGQGPIQGSGLGYGMITSLPASVPPGQESPQQHFGHPLPQTRLPSNNNTLSEISAVNPFDEFLRKN